MNLLGSAAYDPAAAVSKATSSLLAMTAVDTTNLRLAITVPAHGKVLFRLACTITGATTLPTILLGVLNGVTVLKRQAPQIFTGTQNVLTQDATAKAEFVVTGLTPGALNADAAYAVQVVVASTNIKFGGPNDTTGNDAWGAFVFEAWDPQPLTAALDGAVNVKQWSGTNVAAPATAGIPEVNVKNVNNVSAASVTTINANQGTTQPVNFTGTGASALAKSDMVDVAGAAVSTTTAQLGVNAVQINAVSTASVTTVNANQGTTQPVNFTGTGVSALSKSDMVDVAGAAVATGTAQIGVNVVNLGGTAQTGRDVGASVLLSAGSGAGQLDFTSGVVKANLAQILGTALTETAGQLAGAFKKFFNIATPASTMDALTLVATATNLTNAPGAGDFTATMKTSIGTAVAASAVASVTGNVGGNVAGSVASVTAAVTVSGDLSATMKASVTAAVPSAAQNRAEMDANSVGLASIFARTDVATSTRLATAGYTAPDNASITGIKAKTDSLNFTVAGQVNANIKYVNGVLVNGDGAATPWGP